MFAITAAFREADATATMRSLFSKTRTLSFRHTSSLTSDLPFRAISAMLSTKSSHFG